MWLFGRPTRQDDARAEAYRAWVAKRHPLAIASLALGVFSLIEFGALIVPGAAGIVLGIIALVQLDRGSMATGKTHGHRLAVAGIVLSVISLVVATVLYTHPWRR